jgi:hypothetical protein
VDAKYAVVDDSAERHPIEHITERAVGQLSVLLHALVPKAELLRYFARFMIPSQADAVGLEVTERLGRQKRNETPESNSANR